MRLTIYDLVGENCITQEDGDKVYQQVFPELKAGNSVSIDFTGVNIFASPFFNFSIGKLLKDFSRNHLEKSLEMVNLSLDGHDVLERVIENSEQYYQKSSIREAQNLKTLK